MKLNAQLNTKKYCLLKKKPNKENNVAKYISLKDGWEKPCPTSVRTIEQSLGRIVYKWIAAESELQNESELEEKFLAGLPTVGRASLNFFLQFTFSCNLLVHDPGLSILFWQISTFLALFGAGTNQYCSHRILFGQVKTLFSWKLNLSMKNENTYLLMHRFNSIEKSLIGQTQRQKIPFLKTVITTQIEKMVYLF